MKKLKFLALGLVAAFGFAACGDEDATPFCDENAEATQTTVVLGGSQSANGSFFTSDKGVQTKIQLGDVATNVVFCFNTLDEAYQFISGTEATNEIVKAQASTTKFAVIGDATVAKASKLNSSDFKDKKVEISKRIDNGKKAVAFWNETLDCKGFFEVVSSDGEGEKTNLTVNMFVLNK